MAKYSKQLVEKVAELIEEDAYTITDICKILSIDRKSFYRWRNEKADFAEAIAIAMENREERLRMMARKAMKKKLEGNKLVETKTVYTPSKDGEEGAPLLVKEYVVKEKFCVPETSAITFALSEGGGGKGDRKQPTKDDISRPMTVVVQTQEAKRDLELLVHDLRSGAR